MAETTRHRCDHETWLRMQVRIALASAPLDTDGTVYVLGYLLGVAEFSDEDSARILSDVRMGVRHG